VLEKKKGEFCVHQGLTGKGEGGERKGGWIGEKKHSFKQRANKQRKHADKGQIYKRGRRGDSKNQKQKNAAVRLPFSNHDQGGDRKGNQGNPVTIKGGVDFSP